MSTGEKASSVLPSRGRAAAPAKGPLVARTTLAGAADMRLFFAQVREDPLLEIEGLEVRRPGAHVVVSSGGCTLLSLLAAGAERVVGVDLNRTQNHLCELKAAALAALEPPETRAFLGAAPAKAGERRRAYARVRGLLGADAQAHWDGKRQAVERGVLSAGATERFIALICGAIRHLVHSDALMRRVLAARTLEEQRELYDTRWNTRAWRALFEVLVNRRVMSRTYDPAFFRHVENPSFAKHFLSLVEHGLRDLPARTNYFLHHMFTGRYPEPDAGPEALPPYLQDEGAARAGAAIRERSGRLALVDGTVADYLRTQPAGSVAGVSLSNICEWLDAPALDAMLSEIARTAAGGRLVFRNFVGWTEVPERLRRQIVEDRARGEALIARDRSLLQRRIAVCRVEGAS